MLDVHKIALVSFTLALVFKQTLQKSSLESAVYVAAVVEYSPVTSGQVRDVITTNIDNYIQFIQQASSQLTVDGLLRQYFHYKTIKG
ncbi:unnamed protein product [Timema podura]|uniref:Uncharacterized protein n=1 Tax=Timema podura TaxID=61482 RepID=A0ABN7PHJ2_TIMPD|nr:unnamed protein product [Timema podura]